MNGYPLLLVVEHEHRLRLTTHRSRWSLHLARAHHSEMERPAATIDLRAAEHDQNEDVELVIGA